MSWTKKDIHSEVIEGWTNEEIETGLKAANTILESGGTDEEAVQACIKAAGKSEKKMDVVVVANRKLLVLGAPYGGTKCDADGVCRDLHGEYFSPKTDFMIGVDDQRPVIYWHGDNEERPKAIGIATVEKRDDRGLWFDVVLGISKFATKVWEAAGRRTAKASGGTIPHLVRKAKSGELLVWPFAELSLFDESFIRRPANQLAVVELKALFDVVELEMPEGFVEAKAKTDPVERDDSEDTIREIADIAMMIFDHCSKE